MHIKYHLNDQYNGNPIKREIKQQIKPCAYYEYTFPLKRLHNYYMQKQK